MMGSMLPRVLVFTAISVMTWCAPGMGNAQIEAFHAEFDSVLTQHGVVGGGFAFVHGGAPATQDFFGEARNDTHNDVDADNAFNWASITKPMTPIAILQLRDRYKLSLDDAAVRYVPGLREVRYVY